MGTLRAILLLLLTLLVVTISVLVVGAFLYMMLSPPHRPGQHENLPAIEQEGDNSLGEAGERPGTNGKQFVFGWKARPIIPMLRPLPKADRSEDTPNDINIPLDDPGSDDLGGDDPGGDENDDKDKKDKDEKDKDKKDKDEKDKDKKDKDEKDKDKKDKDKKDKDEKDKDKKDKDKKDKDEKND